MKNSKAIAIRAVPNSANLLEQDPAYALGHKLGSIEARLDSLEDQMQDRKLSKKKRRTVMTNQLRSEINIMINNAIEYTKAMIMNDLKQRGIITDEMGEVFPQAERDDNGRLAVSNPVGSN